MMKIDGVSVSQWFRSIARELLAKIGIRSKEPKNGALLYAKTIATESIIYLSGDCHDSIYTS